MNEAKFTKEQWMVGANEMTADEMKARLIETIDASIEHGTAVGRLWSVFVGPIESPLMICFTGNGPTSEANAYAIAAAPEMYEKGQFKRNVIIHDNPEFEGEWIAVPREDFDAFRATLAKARGES